jgi:hypothetical protein
MCKPINELYLQNKLYIHISYCAFDIHKKGRFLIEIYNPHYKNDIFIDLRSHNENPSLVLYYIYVKCKNKVTVYFMLRTFGSIVLIIIFAK